MSELIDRQAFIEQERRLYCEDCDRRKGKKNGKLTVCYEIGEAPCRACWLDDALTDLEDFPTASPWHRVEEELPEIGKTVVVSIYGDMWVATRLDDKRFNGRMYWELSDGSWERVENDMYWMPIPEPPKEDV